MRAFVGYICFLYTVLSTSFICLFSCLEGKIELTAKPFWVIGIVLLLGAITGTVCMESMLPPVRVVRKRQSSRK